KRTSATSSPRSAAPCRRRSYAARRRLFDSSQRDDSGILRRIQNTISAGSTPIRYMYRQASGPQVPMPSHPPKPTILPIAYPDCNTAPPLPRELAGQSSAMIAAPVAHSEPIASPTRNRNTANDTQSQENALRPVSSE